MVVPLAELELPAIGFDGRTPALSDNDLLSLTDDCTAANTTLAKETPDVDPRYRGFALPSLPRVMSDFATSLCSFASSLLSILLPVAMIPSMGSDGADGPAISAGDRTDMASLLTREQSSRLSAGGKARLFARRMVSRCSTRVSR